MLRLILVLACSMPAIAGETAFGDDRASLEAFRAALTRAPLIAAARARVVAATSALRAADVLPDPMVGLGVGRERVRMGEDMTMYGAMIEQAMLRWGERDGRRLAAQAQIDRELAAMAVVVGEQAAEAAVGIAEWMAARDSQVLTRQSRERVAALSEVVRARLAAGGAMIGDLLTLESRAQRLDLRLADLERRQADAQAMVQGRLGLPAEAALPPFAAPDPTGIRIDGNPMAMMAAAMRQEALAMEREAVARGNPETAIGLAWEREAAGTEGQSDAIALTFRMSLPVHRPAYRDAARAARTRAGAARHEASGAAWMAGSQLGRAQRAIAQARQAQLTAESIACRARTEYEAVIQQVGSGGTSVTSALDLLDMITESGMDAIMATLDSQIALAELWRLAPPELPETARTDDHTDHQQHGIDKP